MPNFATHRKINYIMLFLFLFLYFYYGLKQDYKQIVVNIRTIFVFLVSYVLGTELFSPDLDTNSIPSKKLGFIYRPMRWLYPHRGKLHNIFLGWIIQIVYLVVILVIIFIIADKVGHNLYWIASYVEFKDIAAFLAGLFLSDAIHILADKINL